MNTANRFKFSEPKKSNNFLYKDSSKNQSNYKYKDNDFPDLTPTTNKPVSDAPTEPKKYLSAAAVNIQFLEETKIDKVPLGCIKYEKYKGVPELHVTYDEKTSTNSKIKRNTKYTVDINDLVNNWNRYKLKYDEIHGEGAYAEAFYMESIYPINEDFSDTESDYDNNTYDSYEEYET
jgi:hypothetical protein